jgi:hypothetical protein
MGAIHRAGWGDANVDRTERLVPYLSRIVETGLALA